MFNTRIAKDSANYKILLIGNGILSFADGIYHPFLMGFIHDIGGIPLLGAGLGLVLIFDSIGCYLVGKLADKYGRRMFLLINPFLSIAVYIAYPILPLIGEIDRSLMLSALVLLLIIDGLTDGLWDAIEAIYLGDITTKASRSSRMGSYWGIAGFITGVAMLVSGFLGRHIDFLTVTFIVVFIYLSGIIMLFRIKETKLVD